MQALLKTPFNGPWLKLDQPTSVLVAATPADVRQCLIDAEDAAQQGAYVAGFVTYEASSAFGLPLPTTQSGLLPAACFGVFPKNQVVAGGEELLATPNNSVLDELTQSWSTPLKQQDYIKKIHSIKDHIAAGDTYQLNFTFRLKTPFSGSSLNLFTQLVSAQRGEWSAYLDLGDYAICSASPELFFLKNHSHLTCRPMKGTMPRLPIAQADITQAERLRTSTKNQSENVMIVDLMRNDIGRVARTGTVLVDSLFDVEQYPQQWQMTSTISADIGKASLVDIFSALFPSGSVTGAPKHRSMEIINELEDSPRGIYTGAIGLIDPHGHTHFNVAIRTILVDRINKNAEFGVGSGIVWESSEKDEYDECQTKATIVTERAPTFELLETMKWEPVQGFVLLERHLTRLQESAKYFGFDCDVLKIHGTLEQSVINQTTDAKVRLLIQQDGQARCEVKDFQTEPNKHYRATLASTPVSCSNTFLYHKTTNRAVYNHEGEQPDSDTVIFWNESGEITEATDANIVAEIDGKLVTPPVSCGLLAGTFRAELLAHGEIIEQRLSKKDLLDAKRVWLINSLRGWMAAQLLH